MSRKKEIKIENIKSVGEFYSKLREIVSNTFNDYDNVKLFDGWTEEQKKLLYGFGKHILSNVYNPIRKRYVKQEKKKCEKILNNCNELLGKYQKQVINLQSQLNHQKAMWNELKEWLIGTLKEKQNSPKYYKLNEVLGRMEELEGEKDVED